MDCASCRWKCQDFSFIVHHVRTVARVIGFISGKLEVENGRNDVNEAWATSRKVLGKCLSSLESNSIVRNVRNANRGVVSPMFVAPLES